MCATHLYPEDCTTAEATECETCHIALDAEFAERTGCDEYLELCGECAIEHTRNCVTCSRLARESEDREI